MGVQALAAQRATPRLEDVAAKRCLAPGTWWLGFPRLKLDPGRVLPRGLGPLKLFHKVGVTLFTQVSPLIHIRGLSSHAAQIRLVRLKSIRMQV